MKRCGNVLVLFLVLCSLFSLLHLFGCSSTISRRIPDYLYVRLKVSPTTIDPALIVDVYGAQIAAKLYNGLVCFNDDLAPIPDLAESWTVSPDGREYIFRLKKGVLFFNGREVTARDFKYSFERVLNPKTRSPRTWVLSRIQGADAFISGQATAVSGIEVLGPYELKVQLEKPFAPFIKLLGLTTAYVVPQEEVARWGREFSFHGSGTGPYILERWEHNQFLQLKANSSYCAGPPRLGGLIYRIVPEDFTALTEFEAGNIDVMLEIPPAAFRHYADDPRWKSSVIVAPGLNIYYLGLNCQTPPFNNPLVRRALNYAIDREAIVARLLDGRGVIASGILPPLLRTGPAPTGYSYNPGRARALLKQAGYGTGLCMTLYQSADEETLDITQALQGNLRAAGIDARIVQLEWSSFKNAVAGGEATAFWLSWWADYPDAENFLFPPFYSANWGNGGNRSRFSNHRVDELLKRAVSVMDERQAHALYQEIEQLVVQEAPWVFCWHKANCSLYQPWVKNYSVVPLAVMEKWTGITIDKKQNRFRQ
jgi:ABC-type transport system substrate-binding protein